MGAHDPLRPPVELRVDDPHHAAHLVALPRLAGHRARLRAAHRAASGRPRPVRAVAHSAARYTHLLRLRYRAPRTQRPVAQQGIRSESGRRAARKRMKKTLFLNPPSFEGFDGGAGSRYQARREIRSFWYPTWLAQPAAIVDGSKLIDAPPRGITVDDVLKIAGDYELVVIHTSTPSFNSDVKFANAMKEANPKLMIGFVGAHVAVLPDSALPASNRT